MRKIIYFLPAVLYYSLLFYFSQRSYNIELDVPHFDKGIHFLEFAFLAILIFFGYFKSLAITLKTKAVLTFITTTLLAISDEIHHYFVPGRESDILDVAADIGGIIFGLFLFWYFSRRVKLKILAEGSSKKT
jgi:VanZ family protein